MQGDSPGDGQRITKAACRLSEGECVLTWHWPSDIQYVKICSFAAGDELALEQENESRWKVYTREEYKARGGYRVPADFLGVRVFRIYPCVMKEGQLKAHRQSDSEHVARFNGGRAKLRYSIRYGWGWFGKHRSAKLRLTCEIPVPKEALCYVKKSGGVPLHPGDGTRYPLHRDLSAGVTELPEIQIGREDRIRIFLTDGKLYGDLYEIVPE
ncbi:hypothetical protein [Paenibacillus silviterrae]|uniref:hypothetical protein n=1 Tax=Paenibacillus silviterrae TaxID=3242194 RepID=UPI00254360AD|nr:hypothetical protein [Paenibacillus chinjuensis]